MSVLDLSPQKKRNALVTTDVVVEESSDRDVALVEARLAGEAVLGVAPLEMVSELVTNLTAAAKAAEKSVAAFGAAISGLAGPIVEAGQSLNELAAFLEIGEAKYDPEKHPRWPAGTPGGLGGKFMKVGQRFTWHGKDYDVAAVFPGHIWAHVATKGVKAAPKTIEIPADALEGGHPVISGVTRPAAEPILGVGGSGGGKYTNTEKFTGTVIDPYVDPATHDPSIAVPADSTLTPEQWKAFGKLDQERYVQVMELYGPYAPSKAQTLVDQVLSHADPTAKKLLKENHGSQIGSSTGITLSLHSVYGAVLNAIKGSPSVESARNDFESARALQDDVAGVLQWDLYNRTHAPDLAVFHRNDSQSLFQNEVIKGKLPVFSGLSQSASWAPSHNTQFGSNTFATPLAIRHIVMARDTANVNKGSSYLGEKEVATADAYQANDHSMAIASNGLGQMQTKWLAKVTSQGAAPGSTLVTLKESMADSGASLPVPAADPIVEMDYEGGQKYITPPQAATVGAGKLGYSDVDEDGVPIAKPAKDLGLKPGDYVEGMKGTRYLIVADPSYSLGLAYYKVTDQGTPIGEKKPYTLGEIHDQATGNQAYGGHADWTGSPEAYQFGGSEPGLLPFKKLKGHYDLPIESAEFKSTFHPEAWTFSAPDQAKLLAKFDDGEMFHLNGTFFLVQGQLGGGQTRIQNLSTGKLGKINSDYKSAFLMLKEGYSATGQAQLDPADYFKGDHTNIGDGWDSLEAGSIVQVGQTLWKVEQKTDGGEIEMSQASGASANIGKLHTFGPTQIYVPMTQKPPGWEPPEIGDTLAVEGKKGTVTKILKNGDVQVNLAPGVVKLHPSDPLLAGLYAPAKWSVGDKTKLKQLPDGALFHGGTGAKVKPYMVLSHGSGGKTVLVKNLDNGEQTTLSGNKGYAALHPKVSLSSSPVTEVTDPPAQVEQPLDLVDQFDPEKWEAGPHKSLADLIPGDVVVLSGKPYKVDAFTGPGEDQAELKNLTTGEVFAFSKHGATLSGITTLPTLQGKGLGEQFVQQSASPVGPVQVLPSELHVGDVIDTNPLKPGSYTYEVLGTKATPTGAKLTLKGVGTEDSETYIDQDWVDEKIAEKHSWTLVSSKKPPFGDLPTPLEGDAPFDAADWEGWEGTPPVPASVLIGMTTKPQPGTVLKAGSTYYAVTHTTPGDMFVKQVFPVPAGQYASSFPILDSELVQVMTKKDGSLAPNLATSYEDVSGDVVSPHDVPVGTLLAVKGLGGEDAVVWKTTGKQGGLEAVLVATPDGLPETTLTPTGVAIGDTWKLVGDKSFVKVALKGAPPAPVEPDFAPVYATSFDPSVYKTVPATGMTLGQINAGEIFQGKSGAYFQLKKASGANVYATNLSTGKATKLAAKIEPAKLLVKPPDVAYDDLKPGSPVLLGKLKPGDQYLAHDVAGAHLMQVLELAPDVPPDDETMQVKVAPVLEDGSLGHPQVAGNSQSKFVMFKAFEKDVPPQVPISTLPPKLDIDALPVLKVGAATGKDWLINPYLHPHSGKNVYTKIKEMPPGAVFHDKDGQHFKVVSGPGEQMAVLSGGTGTAYQVNGNLRGKFVEPADMPMEAKAVFDAADVDVPDTLPDQTLAKLVAPKMKANSESQNIAGLGLGAGDWVEGLAGSKFSNKPMQITESGGEVAGKPTWWKAVDAEGHPTTLSMTAVPTKYWKATDLLSPVAPTGPDAFFDSLANGDKAAYVGPHNHPSNPPMSVTVTDNQIVGGGIQVKSDTSGAEFQAFKGELSPSAQTTATPVGSPDLTAGWPPVDYTVVGQVPVAELSTGDVFKSQTNDTVLKVTGEDDDGVWVLDVTKTVGAIHMASSDWGDTQVTLLKPSGATTAVNKVTKEPLDFDSLDGFTHNPEGTAGELGPGAYFTAPGAEPGTPHTIWQVTGAADSSGNVPIKVVYAPSSPTSVGKDSSVKTTTPVGYSAAAELPADPNAFDLGDFTPNEIGVTLGMLKPGDQFSDGPHNFVFELLPTASSEPGKVSVKTLWPQVTAGQIGVHSAEFVPALVKQAASTPKPSSAAPSSSLGDYTEGEQVTLGDLTPGTIFKSLSASVFQVTGEGKAKNLKTGAEIAHLLPSMPATPLYPKDEAVPPTLSAGVPSFAQIKAGLAPGWVPNTETLKTLKLKQGDMFTGSGVKGPGGVGAEDGVFHVVGAGTSTGAGIDAKVLIPHSIPNGSEAGTVSGFSDGFTPAFVWHSGDLPPAGSAPSLPVAPAVTLGTSGSDMQFGEVQTGEWFVDDMGDTWKKVGPFTGLLMKAANSPASAPANHEETFSSEDEVTMIEKPRPQVGDKLPFGELPVGTKFKMIDNDGDPSGPEHEKTADYEFTNTVTGDVGTMPEHGLNVFYEVTGVPGGSQPAQATATPSGPVVHDQDGNVIEPDDTVVALDGKSHEVASISPTGGVVFKEGGAVYPSTVKVTKKGSAGDSSGIDFAGKTGFTPNDDTPLSDMPVGTYFSIGGDYGVWQTTGPPVGGKIPQKLVWSAIAANAGETGEVPETYVPAWTHPPEGALLGPSEPNSAGFQTGQKINVVSPGGTWSHVEVLDTNLGGVKVKLPNIDIPQIIPNDWAHADPLVAGSPGGAPMKAKVGDEVQFKSPTTAESTYPAEITQLGPALATLKYEDGSTTQIPKGWISKIVKTSFGDGSTGEPSQLVGSAGVHVGDVISPPPEPVALDANGNVVQAADPPHWEVTDSGLATVGLKLVKQPTIDGKPIESSLSLDTPHTIEVKDAAAWTMIQQAPAPSGKKQSMYELAPGKLFFSQDLAGVPAGTYQKLPAGMEKLYPATDVDPGEGHDDIWIRNVGDGKVYWTAGSLEVQPMGNVTPPVKGYDFDPSGYEDGLPDTTMYVLVKSPGTIVMVGTDHYMINRADEDGGAGVTQLTGSDAGKTKTFGPDTVAVVQVTKKGGSAASASQAASGEFVSDYDEGTSLIPDLWDKTKSTISAGAAAGPDPLVLLPPGTVVRSGTGTFYEIQGTTTAPDTGEPTMLVKAISTTLGGEGLSEYEPPFPILPSAVLTVMKPQKWSSSSGSFESHPDALPATKEWTEFPNGADAWTLGGKHVKVTLGTPLEGVTYDDGTFLVPSSPLYVSDPLATAEPTNQIAAGYAVPGDEVEWDYGQWHLKGTVTKKTESGHLTVKLIDPPDSFTGGQVAGNFGIPPTQMLTSITPKPKVAAEDTVGNVPKGSIVTLSGGKPLVVGDTVVDKMDGSVQVRLLDPENWPQLYTVAPVSEAVGSVKLHPVAGYQYAHSGKKKFPKVGELPVGARFHGKSKEVWEVAETPKDGVVKVWRTEMESGGTTLTTTFLPWDLRVFHLG